MVRLSIRDALAALGAQGGAQGETYVKLFAERALDIALYKPDRIDPQTPHLRDEIYVVATGSGRFIQADESRAFGPGDLLFVPRGVPHRFVDFSDDFSTWVIFFGEIPSEPSP